MSHASDLIASDIEAYLAEHERKDLLRLLTCGSVDDGKSTLIGRLLHDTKLLYEDQLEALNKDSKTHGTVADGVDLALLTDGLRAEREQGITIDVAYRYFSTAKRKFIIADTPGHEQYTRNMATGASNCDLAVILIDARHGVMPQTRRHSFVVDLLGITQVVLAINKMDLVGYRQGCFDEIVDQYRELASNLGQAERVFVPMSALAGDMVVDRLDHLDWYDGPTLMEHLESVSVSAPIGAAPAPLRFPVQLVSRPDLDFRGYQGTISSGSLRPADSVRIEPAGITSRVSRIVSFDGDLDLAVEGDAVTVVLEDQVDVSRGDVITSVESPLSRGHNIDAMLIWMSESPFDSSADLLIQQGHRRVGVKLNSVDHKIDINTLAPKQSEDADSALELNDIARVELHCDAELLFDPYEANHTMGSFILLDRLSNATVAAGMIRGATGAWGLSPALTLEAQTSEVAELERSTRYRQLPVTVFLTGLTGAGKSTIAKELERRLFDSGRVAVRLDGEDMRLGISRDLGFSAQERSENLRRTSEVALLLNNQGLIVIAALVAPKSAARALAKELIGPDRYLEIFLDPPPEVCRSRDSGGLYIAAERGEIPQFPGVSATYDKPTDAALVLDTSVLSVAQCVRAILDLLSSRGFVQ